MVQLCSHLYQPSRETAAENVMKTLKPRSRYSESSKKSETSAENAKHSLLATWEPCQPAEPAHFEVKFGGSW